MLLEFDPETGVWGKRGTVHSERACAGRLCDVHNRRGTGPQAAWPLNWRGDRAMMEVICPHGVGHPTPAQMEYYRDRGVEWLSIHGCCGEGCCDYGGGSD